ncbi:MerR family transcriptional regulator [Actinomadura graeca]|uniref:MerR family transcriptional regulator n=1 Tax=Actinomadura graeca TaxID=2750812 RepID=A0ABX8R5N5_9ACTN|nr:MerR family transcriptional regulator [Actinomadura graeca]QXJ25584.1 MerR family transcriptional regulator [Actinomadura graeca]
MRIGELSARTGTTPRLLRYYEEQGLITPARSANGYRDYDERLVDRVAQIRGLLGAGLPTRIIRDILPCLDGPRVIHLTGATPEMIATLERERDQMTVRIACLTRNRDAIDGYLNALRARGGGTPAATSPPPAPGSSGA